MSSEKANLSLAEEHRPITIPIVSFFTIFMFIGVIGNAAVIYIYGFKLKKSTVHYFITVLAVFDFICCLLGFPLEITEFYYAMDYPSNELCKWQRFLTFGCNIGSAIVLLLISIERYRKVCWPANYQIKLGHAKYFTLGACFSSVLLAIPVTLFTSNNEIQLNRNRTGYDCSLSSEYGMLPHIYFIVLLISTTLTLVTMLILYGLLRRTARRHFLRSDSSYQQNVNNTKAGKSPARRQMSRTNYTVLLVTILFTVSFFPTLILSIFVDQLMDENDFKGMIIFIMFKRMYILNNSLNPIVYGLCNKYFRNAFLGLFRKIFCLSSSEIQHSSTDTS